MMKQLATALIVASFTLPPAMAFAQTGGTPLPPPGSGAPHGDGQMQQIRGQMETIRKQERDRVLGALTPAHRQLLANIVGQMAVSQNPDRRAAAAQLDAALSTDEKNAILGAHQEAMTQMHALWQQHMQSQQSGAMQGPPGGMQRQHAERVGTHQLTAGGIALMVSRPAPDFHRPQ
jgi:hypothetical protein